MIQYIIDTENKVIHLRSGGTMEELREISEVFKDYSFSYQVNSESIH